MAGQSKILLDSNSYFRLANSVHPLLFTEFGEDQYCLYACPQLNKELLRSSRLRSKFSWVGETKYIENRRRNISVSKKDKEDIARTVDFLCSFALEIKFPPAESIPSEVDLEVLAFGSVLGIPVVTDDRAMHRVASQFSVATWSTLELLKLMCDCGHIDQEKISEIGNYWTYENDLPAKFRDEWSTLFDLPFPHG